MSIPVERLCEETTGQTAPVGDDEYLCGGQNIAQKTVQNTAGATADPWQCPCGYLNRVFWYICVECGRDRPKIG